MTKLRDPDSIHDALRQAVGLLGDRVVAEICGCSEQLIQAYSDADNDREITGARMVLVDAAMVKAGFHPVFAVVLTRLASDALPDAVAAPVPSPLNAVMAITGVIGSALATMAKSATDGAISRAELSDCLSVTDTLRNELARCRRALFAALRHASSSPKGKR